MPFSEFRLPFHDVTYGERMELPEDVQFKIQRQRMIEGIADSDILVSET